MYELSEFEEMYLKRMWEILNKEPDGIVKTTILAEFMGVSPASTTEMLQRLATKNMVTNIPYKGSRLTSEGFSVAARIKRRQYLLEILLSEIIGYDGDVTAAACELEHSINDDLEASIDRILGYPDHTRDGQRIPLVERDVRAFSQDVLLPAVNLPNGKSGIIELIVLNQTDNKTLEGVGISIGSTIEKSGEKYILNNKEIEISETIASGIITRTMVV
tara:strand:+ start:32806 stop:33459 length:654 start_codon:yes stop_codon:yes gene_type:complete